MPIVRNLGDFSLWGEIMKKFKQVITYLVIMTLVVGLLPTNIGFAEEGDQVVVVEKSNDEPAAAEEKKEEEPAVDPAEAEKKSPEAEAPAALAAPVVKEEITSGGSFVSTFDEVQTFKLPVDARFADIDGESVDADVTYENGEVTITIPSDASPSTVTVRVDSETLAETITFTITSYYERNLKLSTIKYEDLDAHNDGLNVKYYDLAIAKGASTPIPAIIDDIYGVDKHNGADALIRKPFTDEVVQGKNSMISTFKNKFNDSWNKDENGDATDEMSLYFSANSYLNPDNSQGDVYYQGLYVYGYFVPETSGTYTIKALHDDGCIVSLDGVEAVNHWKPVSPTITSLNNTYNLVEGTAYPIVARYFENQYSGAAFVLVYNNGNGDIAIPSTMLKPSTDQKGPDRREITMTLNGDAEVEVIMGTSYTDEGVTITPDDTNVAATSPIKITKSTEIFFEKENGDRILVSEVNLNQIGKYVYVYNASNTYSTADTVERIVNVVPGDKEDFVYIINYNEELIKYWPYKLDPNTGKYGISDLYQEDVADGSFHSIGTFNNGRVLSVSNGRDMFIDIDLGKDGKHAVEFMAPSGNHSINALAVGSDNLIYFGYNDTLYSTSLTSLVINEKEVYKTTPAKVVASLGVNRTIGDIELIGNDIYLLLWDGSDNPGLFKVEGNGVAKVSVLDAAGSAVEVLGQSFGLAATSVHQFITLEDGNVQALSKNDSVLYFTEFNAINVYSTNLADASRGIERKPLNIEIANEMSLYETESKSLLGPNNDFAGYDVTYVYDPSFITIDDNGMVTAKNIGKFDGTKDTNVAIVVHNGKDDNINVTVKVKDLFYSLEYNGEQNAWVPDVNDDAGAPNTYAYGYTLTNQLGQTTTFTNPAWTFGGDTYETADNVLTTKITDLAGNVTVSVSGDDDGQDIRPAAAYAVIVNRPAEVFTLTLNPLAADQATVAVPTLADNTTETRDFTYSIIDNFNNSAPLDNPLWTLSEVKGVSIVNGTLSVNSPAEAGTLTVTLSGTVKGQAVSDSTTAELTREALVWDLSVVNPTAMVVPSTGTNEEEATYVLNNQYELNLALTSVNWEVNHTGVSFTGSTLVVAPEALALVEASSTGYAMLNIYPNGQVDGVEIKDVNGDEVYGQVKLTLEELEKVLGMNGASSIDVPTLGQPAVNKDYTLSFVDQYGRDFMDEVTDVEWSLVEGSVTGVTLVNGILSVTNEATADAVTVQAITNKGTITKAVALTYEFEYAMGLAGADIVYVPGNKAKSANTEAYVGTLTNNYGHDLSGEEITYLIVDPASTATNIIPMTFDNISLSTDGILSVDKKQGSTVTYTGNITIMAVAKNGTVATKTVDIRRSAPKYALGIRGKNNINIPFGDPVSKDYNEFLKNQYDSGLVLSNPVWSVTDINGNTATGVTINQDGLLTVSKDALALLATGEVNAKIKVTVSGNTPTGESITKTKKVTLKKLNEDLTLTVNQLPAILAPSTGIVAQVQATHTLVNQYGEAVTIINPVWEIENDQDNDGISIDQNGLITVTEDAQVTSINVLLSGDGVSAERGTAVINVVLTLDGAASIIIPGTNEANVTEMYNFTGDAVYPSGYSPLTGTSGSDEPIMTLTFDVDGSPVGLSTSIDGFRGALTVTSATQEAVETLNGSIAYSEEFNNGMVYIAAGTVISTTKEVELIKESRFTALNIAGPTRVEIPRAGENNNDQTYQLQALDQYGRVIDLVDNVIWDLADTYPGVTFDNGTGILTVSSAANPRSILMRAVIDSDDIESVYLPIELVNKPIVVPPTPETKNLSITVVGEGSVSPAVSNYNTGSTASLIVVPAEGWEFVGFSGPVDENNQIIMNQDYAITATFEEIEIPEIETPLANPDPEPTEEEEIIEIEENETPLADLPQTGGMDSVFFYIIGGLFILLGSGMFNRRSKSHN